MKFLRRITKPTLYALLAMLISMQTILPAQAISPLDKGLPYYIQGDVCSNNSSGTSTPNPNNTLPTDIQTKIKQLQPTYEAAAKQVDIPWQILAGIHYREAGLRTDADLQAGNPFGGPYNQSSTSYAKYGYPKNLEESLVIAGKVLQDDAQQSGLFKKKLSATAVDTEAIKDALFTYNGRASVYAQQAATLGFDPVKQPYEGSPYVMSKFDAKHTDMKIITKDGGGLDGIDARYGAFTIYFMLGGALSGGGCGGGVAGGSLQSFVLKYAWPTYHAPNYYDMMPDYRDAVNAARQKGQYVGGIAHPGIDCGGFVTLLMKNSGIDPDYNKYNGTTYAQQKYLDEQVASPTGKYTKITNPNSGNVHAGDIAINSEHTFIYVGTIPGFSANIASASLEQRAPMADTQQTVNNSFSWYHLKQATTSTTQTGTPGNAQP